MKTSSNKLARAVAFLTAILLTSLAQAQIDPTTPRSEWPTDGNVNNPSPINLPTPTETVTPATTTEQKQAVLQADLAAVTAIAAYPQQVQSSLGAKTAYDKASGQLYVDEMAYGATTPPPVIKGNVQAEEALIKAVQGNATYAVQPFITGYAHAEEGAMVPVDQNIIKAQQAQLATDMNSVLAADQATINTTRQAVMAAATPAIAADEAKLANPVQSAADRKLEAQKLAADEKADPAYVAANAAYQKANQQYSADQGAYQKAMSANATGLSPNAPATSVAATPAASSVPAGPLQPITTVANVPTTASGPALPGASATNNLKTNMAIVSNATTSSTVAATPKVSSIATIPSATRRAPAQDNSGAIASVMAVGQQAIDEARAQFDADRKAHASADVLKSDKQALQEARNAERNALVDVLKNSQGAQMNSVTYEQSTDSREVYSAPPSGE